MRRTGSVIRRHLRSNVVGYVALILAMSTSAGALQGKNTVFSDDIVDEQVRTSDVGGSAVSSPKIGPGQVTKADIEGGAVKTSKVGDGTLSGSDIFGNSLSSGVISGLTGADINEGTLVDVPRAMVAGRGRHAQGTSCDPESTTFVTCATVTFDLPASGRVLIHGYGTGYTESGSDSAQGACRPYSSATDLIPESASVMADDNSGGEFGLSTVTSAIGPGTVTFEVRCNQDSNHGAILYEKVSISVIQFGSS